MKNFPRLYFYLVESELSNFFFLLYHKPMFKVNTVLCTPRLRQSYFVRIVAKRAAIETRCNELRRRSMMSIDDAEEIIELLH